MGNAGAESAPGSHGTGAHRKASSSTNGEDLRALLVASVAGLAVNFLSSLFSGSVAVVLMVVCLGVLVLLLRRQTIAGQAEPTLARLVGSIDSLAFIAASVLVGALLGGLSVLRIFSDVSFRVPWTELFDPYLFDYEPSFHGYELLASAFVTVIATVPLFMGQHLLRVLGFAVAAVGGAVAVFSAFGPSFSSPMQTFLGWSVAVAAAIGLVSLLPRGSRALFEFFRKPASRVRTPEIQQATDSSTRQPSSRSMAPKLDTATSPPSTGVVRLATHALWTDRDGLRAHRQIPDTSRKVTWLSNGVEAGRLIGTPRGTWEILDYEGDHVGESMSIEDALAMLRRHLENEH